MLKIQTEDKDMVEQLKYDQLTKEYSVQADLPQIMFRKLRQQVGFADSRHVTRAAAWVSALHCRMHSPSHSPSACSICLACCFFKLHRCATTLLLPTCPSSRSVCFAHQPLPAAALLQYVDLGYGVHNEQHVPPFAANPVRERRDREQ
jgi:hypothetical protein